MKSSLTFIEHPFMPSRARGLFYVAAMTLVLFTGACTIFALVITTSQAWQEHSQASWPDAMGQVKNCELVTKSYSPHRLYIRCAVNYAVGDEKQVAHFYSKQVAPPAAWQYPANQIQPLYDWLNTHPDRMPILLRYDPANHAKAVIASDYLPGGGPHTQNNLKLLGVCATAFAVLFMLGRLVRPRAPWRVTPPSAAAPLG
jgi:uncharacterized protein DUF3592